MNEKKNPLATAKIVWNKPVHNIQWTINFKLAHCCPLQMAWSKSMFIVCYVRPSGLLNRISVSLFDISFLCAIIAFTQMSYDIFRYDKLIFHDISYILDNITHLRSVLTKQEVGTFCHQLQSDYLRHFMSWLLRGSCVTPHAIHLPSGKNKCKQRFDLHLPFTFNPLLFYSTLFLYFLIQFCFVFVVCWGEIR